MAYRIPDCNLFRLTEQIEKLNKRAKRLHQNPIIMTTVGEEFELWVSRDTAWDMVELGYRIPWEKVKLNPGESIMDAELRVAAVKRGAQFQVRRFALVEVTGEAPRLPGWEFVAAIQHEEGGNILACCPGWKEKLPERFRDADSMCDHCGTERVRKDTYIVKSDAGVFKQVGRSCLKDFTGHKDPNTIAEWAEVMASLDGLCSGAEDDDFFGGTTGPRWLPVGSFLQVVAYLLRVDGWVSRKYAREFMKQSTSDAALEILYPGRAEKAREASRLYAENTTDEDQKTAIAAMEWAAQLEPTVEDDYLWNLRVLANSEGVNIRRAGLLASMVYAYRRKIARDLEFAAKAKAGADSVHVGTVGKREVFTITVQDWKEFEGEYGTTTLFRFHDQAGNRLIWWASGHPEEFQHQGMTVDVKATVKDHSDYHGTKQTQLSRVSTVIPELCSHKKKLRTEFFTPLLPGVLDVYNGATKVCPACFAKFEVEKKLAFEAEKQPTAA